MSLWELEYFENTAGTGTGDKRTMAEWGFASLDLEQFNWSRGDLVLKVRTGTAFSDNPTFAPGNKIVVWRDGVRRWHGWHIAPQRNLTAPAEARTYRFGDCWYLLEQYHPKHLIVIKDRTFTDVTVELSGGPLTYQVIAGCTWETPLGDIVWADWDDQSTITAQGQVRRALYSAIWAGAPIAIGSIDIDMHAAEQDAYGQTCASSLQAAGRFAINSVSWWDPSGATPVFHCSDRAGAASQNHPLADAVETVALAPLHDQQAFAVRLRYWAGVHSIYTADDTAGDDARPEGFGTLIVDLPVSDEVNAYKSKRYGIAAKMFAALGPLSWGGQIDLHEVSSALPWYRPGHALNLTGGRAELATMAAIVQQVTHHVGAETKDTCTVTLGAPNHLGVQDWFELANIGGLAGGAGGGGQGDPATSAAAASTYDDLMPGGPAGSYSPTWSVEDEQQGGLCTIYGYAEFASVSSSPRYYLTDALSGIGDFDTYTGAERVWLSNERNVATGASNIDPTTGVVTSTKQSVLSRTGSADVTTTGANLVAESCGVGGGAANTLTVTRLVRLFEQASVIEAEWEILGSTTCTQTLSNENTEDAELARRRAGWSWAASTGEVATYSIRSDRTFSWSAIRRRATTISGMKPRGTYLLNFPTTKTDLGSQVTVAGDPVSVAVSADANGAASVSDWAELMPERGFTKAWASGAEIVPQ